MAGFGFGFRAGASRLALGAGGGGGGASFDHIIASDADWATVLALGAALSGASVGVEPGSYASQTITLDLASPVVFTATTPWLTTRMANLILKDSNNVTFEDIDFVSAAWGPGAAPCVGYQRASTGGLGNRNIKFNSCARIGNYRGTIDYAFDAMTDDIPEYACISVDTVADTAGNPLDPATLVVTRDYVGDLLADGTGYAMDFSELNAVAGSGAAGTFDVVAGRITNAVLSNAGTGYPTSATRARSARIAWTGQHRMNGYLASGDQSLSGGGLTTPTITGAIELNDCPFRLLANAYKPGTPGTSTKIIGCDFDLIYQDWIAMGLDADTSPPYIEIAWNTGSRPISRIGDAGDPHSDPMQLWMDKVAPTSNVDLSPRIYGNRFWIGASRGEFQGCFLADPPPANTNAYGGYIVGNIVLSRGLPNLLTLEWMRDAYLWRNTMLRYDPANAVNTSASSVTLGGGTGGRIYGASYVGRTISESFLLGATGGGTIDNLDNNAQIGKNGAIVPYTTVFPAFAGTKATAADVVAALTPTVGGLYDNIGAIGSDGYIDYAARTINTALEPAHVKFAAAVNQTASSATSSAWCRVLPDTGRTMAISISGGTYQIADDAAGTGATAATSASGTVIGGKFVRVNVTNGAGSSATTTATLTIAGKAFGFSSTTASTAVYPAVAFDGADRFVAASGAMAGADSRYLTLALKMKFPASAPVTSTFLYGVLSGAAAVDVQLLTSGLVRVNIRNFAGTAIGVINMTGASLCDGGVHELLITADLDQATAANGRSFFIDGADRTGTTGTWTGGSGVTIGYSRTGSIQYTFGGTSATMLSGAEVQYFYANCAARVDATDPVARAKFAADLIGTSGSGITGTAPQIFLVGNASQWNNGAGLNFGTGAKYIAAGGSAVTDVGAGTAWA